MDMAHYFLYKMNKTKLFKKISIFHKIENFKNISINIIVEKIVI